MTGFLTRAMPAPPFLALGGPFAFDLVPVYRFRLFQRSFVKVNRVVPGGVALRDPPLWATWLPQGGNCVVPLNPIGADGAGLVLTAELTGCTIVVDRTPAGLRIYHVQPNRMMQEYHRIRNVLGDQQVDILLPADYDSQNFNANVVVYWNGVSWQLACQRWTGAFINRLAGAYIDNYAYHDTIERDL